MVLADWFPNGATLLSRHECTLLQIGTRPDMILYIARMYNSNDQRREAGRSSGGRALFYKGRLIEHAWQVHLQLGLFFHSNQWTTTGPSKAVCGKVQINNPLLLIGKSSICGDSGFPLKKNVIMTIYLTSNSH